MLSLFNAFCIFSHPLTSFAFLYDKINSPFLFSCSSTYTSISLPISKLEVFLNSDICINPSDLKSIFTIILFLFISIIVPLITLYFSILCLYFFSLSVQPIISSSLCG